MIAGLRLLVVFCADTEASRGWYERAGFEYLRGYDGMHWFRLGDAEIMLHPAQGPIATGSPKVHVAVEDVDALFRQVVARGLQPTDHQEGGRALAEPVTRPWGDREFELVDPDGHVWAFTQR